MGPTEESLELADKIIAEYGEAATLEIARGRAKYLRDIGEVKSPQIIESLITIIESQRLSRAAEPVCTCPSGDGSLRWPCPRHPPEPADAATKALAALGHVRKPNERCTARYAEAPKKDRPPGPASAPVWCCLRAGHDGPHKCSHYGMHPPFVMRPDQTVMGDPLPDVCSKCGTRWPCPDAASVIAAMAQEGE